MTHSTAIRAQGLCRRQGQRWVLLHVHLEVLQGAGLLLAGGNGAGKSTLLRLLSTLNPPSQGSLELFGTCVQRDRHKLRQSVGLLGHHNQLYAELSPLDHLKFWGKLSGQAMNPELLERVGLADRAEDPVRQFSAGMRKRLALARLMQGQPELILLDEPFGQLDGPGMALMETVIHEWRAEGRTVVLATHLIERGKPLCDQALVLAHGKVHWQGEAAALTAKHVEGGAP